MTEVQKKIRDRAIFFLGQTIGRIFLAALAPDIHEKKIPGPQDLSADKFSSLYDAWRPKNAEKPKPEILKKMKTLNGRLPLKDGSVRPQTLGKPVSEHPRHFIFSPWTKKEIMIFRKIFFEKYLSKNHDLFVGPG